MAGQHQEACVVTVPIKVLVTDSEGEVYYLTTLSIAEII